MTTFTFRHKCYSPTAEESCFDSWHRQVIVLLYKAYKPNLGPKQPPSEWVLGASSTAIKRPGREADVSPPCIALGKNGLSYPSNPPYALLSRFVINHLKTKHRLPYLKTQSVPRS